jgi:hypothetical protein
LRHLANTLGAPSAAGSWLFELRGEATRRGLRRSETTPRVRIYSALVSRPTTAAQLERRGAASQLDPSRRPAPGGDPGSAGRLTRRIGSATVSASTMSGRPAGCGPQGRRCESAATPSL